LPALRQSPRDTAILRVCRTQWKRHFLPQRDVIARVRLRLHSKNVRLPLRSEVAAVFTPDTFRFFRELARNNHKPWMDVNRERYRASVVEPFRALLDRLTPLVRKLDSRFEVSGRTGENFSRINRDIRFAADKSPYRTHFYLFFRDRPSMEHGGGELYVGVSAEAVTVGFRIYFEGRESALARLAIPRALENGPWLNRQERKLARKYESYTYTSEKGEWTKHKGWPAAAEWKRVKGWIVRRKFSPTAAMRADFVAQVGKIFRQVFPLYRFTSLPDCKS
jgi:uncharacterized protein (TIGR02453 family)